MPDRHIPRTFLWLMDLLCLSAAFAWAYASWPALRAWALGNPAATAYFGVAPAVTPRPLTEHLLALAGIMPATLVALELFGAYRQLGKLSRTRIVLSGIFAPFAGLSGISLLFFAVRADAWSRLVLFTFAAGSAVLLTGYRLALRAYIKARARSGAYARTVVIVGTPSTIARVAEHYRRTVSPAAYRLAGYLTITADQPDPFIDDPSAQYLPRLGAVDDLANLLVHHPIQEVVAVLPTSDSSHWLRQVIRDCDYLQVTVHIVPEALLMTRWRDLQVVFGSDQVRLPEVVLKTRQIDSDVLFVKRMIDIVVSAVALLLLAPVFLAIAVAIKLTTPGLPIFYEWYVVGFQGKRFKGYKFTTMVADADERKAELMHLNEMSGPVFKIKEDPRITTLGRFLRKFSLNELPQFWSVLKGDMSLVGPRPAGPHELVGYDVWHKRKLSVRPGITCLWQVRGRNAITSFDDWVRMDLEYIDHWSLWLDFKILIRTAWVVVRGTGS